MSTPSLRRVLMTLMAAAALMIGVLAGASSANASTLYACVKKNGSAHIYSKKPKCKKGESKLSWNSSGPAGKNGANGTNGANGSNGAAGTNGAVAGYVVAQTGFIDITKEKKLILSKTLPAGNFLVSAKVETSAAGKSSGLEESRCELFDGATLDESQWSGPLQEFILGTFIGGSTLPLQAAVTLPKPTAVQLFCEAQLNKATSGEQSAEDGVLSAVQTSSNS